MRDMKALLFRYGFLCVSFAIECIASAKIAPDKSPDSASQKKDDPQLSVNKMASSTLGSWYAIYSLVYMYINIFQDHAGSIRDHSFNRNTGYLHKGS